MARNNWTREQTIVAFNLYCKIPFKKSSARHPKVIEIANIIGSSPAALNMKIGNLGRLDPELKKQGIVGLSKGSKLDKVIWEEFHGNWEELVHQSEMLIDEFRKKNEDKMSITLENIQGKDKLRTVKTRVNQNFFRQAILSSYNYSCCITGLKMADLLIASHIIPWSQNQKERLNPKNGLCLNALHDKAFDKGYLTVSPNFEILISDEILEIEKNEAIEKYFLPYHKTRIQLPDKFIPNKEFLEFHNQHIFKH